MYVSQSVEVASSPPVRLALRPLSQCHRGEEIYEIYNVCHSMSCLVSSVHTRHESRTRVGAETCAYSPSNMFICLSSDVVM